MRVNLPVSGVEREFPDSARLISETTLKGVITYVNDDFCEVSGYSREELIGQAHNLIRHPDMPQQVFKNFWDTLKAGRPWLGVVKNRCKNGDHYWVSAYVMPLFEGGRMVGYQSVRTRPSRERIERAEKLYAAIRRRGRLPRPALLSPGLRAAGCGALAVGVGSGLGAGLTPTALALAAPLAAALAGGVGYVLSRRQARAGRLAREVFANPVSERVYGGGTDACAAVELALATRQAQALTLLGRIDDFSAQLMSAAQDADAMAARTGNATRMQHGEIEQVAAAVSQMSAVVQEVALSTNEAAGAAERGAAEARDGKRVIEGALSAMQALVEEVERTAGEIDRLQGETEQIRSVMDVIGAISAQTNLLALNAAIEAARAGAAGRGFAVVADEVRSLAQKSGESAESINAMIESLRERSASAVAVMNRGRDEARRVMALAAEAGARIEAMEEAVRSISDMNSRIASAGEEQAATAGELGRNIGHITEATRETAEAAARGKEVSDRLVEMVASLQDLLKQFEQAR